MGVPFIIIHSTHPEFLHISVVVEDQHNCGGNCRLAAGNTTKESESWQKTNMMGRSSALTLITDHQHPAADQVDQYGWRQSIKDLRMVVVTVYLILMDEMQSD